MLQNDNNDTTCHTVSNIYEYTNIRIYEHTGMNIHYITLHYMTLHYITSKQTHTHIYVYTHMISAGRRTQVTCVCVPSVEM